MRTLALLFVLSLAAVNPYVRGDGNGYYAWLRSPAIDRDIDFGNEYLRADPLFRAAFVDDTGAPIGSLRTPDGRVGNQWSVGPAILWFPFFAIAHVFALLGAGTPDGYSPIYLRMVAMGSAFYGFVAILLGIDLARRLGAPRALLAGVTAWLATSLPVYMYVLPFHVHALAAFITGLFFWWGLREAGGTRWWLVWGAIGGLMVAVYYVHAVLLGIVAWQLVRGIGRARVQAAVAFAAGALPFLALHFWSRYALYGSMATTGYQDQFYWLSPRLLATAFSVDHGLFLWTPAILLALAGLIALARRDRRGLVMLASWAVLFYVIASYQNWHGQSSFGNRFFVSLTAIFIPGMAMALAWLGTKHRALPAALVAVLAAWNAGFVFQWALNIVPNRGPVSFADVARNQVTVVPARIAGVAYAFFFDRGALTREVETGDSREHQGYRPRR